MLYRSAPRAFAAVLPGMATARGPFAGAAVMSSILWERPIHHRPLEDVQN